LEGRGKATLTGNCEIPSATDEVELSAEGEPAEGEAPSTYTSIQGLTIFLYREIILRLA
jgi:hypothetical protein